MVTNFKQYLWNIIIWVDQGLNVLTGGSPDHTVSGRVGFHSARGSKTARVLEVGINLLFFLQKDHCWLNIEWDIVARDYPQYTIISIKESKKV